VPVWCGSTVVGDRLLENASVAHALERLDELEAVTIESIVFPSSFVVKDFMLVGACLEEHMTV
jgi:hypothetical protein